MSEQSDSDEKATLYEEVRRLEGHIEHVNQLIADLGIEQGDSATELQEKGLSAGEIKAAKRYTKVMHTIANEVEAARDSDDDDDGGGSSFKVDGPLQ